MHFIGKKRGGAMMRLMVRRAYRHLSCSSANTPNRDENRSRTRFLPLFVSPSALLGLCGTASRLLLRGGGLQIPPPSHASSTQKKKNKNKMPASAPTKNKKLKIKKKKWLAHQPE
jgi:hypothetical protein